MIWVDTQSDGVYLDTFLEREKDHDLLIAIRLDDALTLGVDESLESSRARLKHIRNLQLLEFQLLIERLHSSRH